VLHSTESHDRKGLDDVLGVEAFLERQTPYEIHLIVDAEGNTAAALDARGHVAQNRFDHCPPVHDHAFGIEMIGFAKFDAVDWWAREPQLRKVARWLAYFHAHFGVQLIGDTSATSTTAAMRNGVVMHRQVSKRFGKTDHTDPGVFPLNFVLDLSATYYKFGWRSGGLLVKARDEGAG
jgi:hypothetical protein